MTITATPNPQTLFFSELDQILQAQDGGGNKGVLWFVLDALTPIFKSNLLIHLQGSDAYHVVLKFPTPYLHYFPLIRVFIDQNVSGCVCATVCGDCFRVGLFLIIM